MIPIFFVFVFDIEIVDYECEDDVAGRVFEEAGVWGHW